MGGRSSDALARLHQRVSVTPVEDPMTGHHEEKIGLLRRAEGRQAEASRVRVDDVVRNAPHDVRDSRGAAAGVTALGTAGVVAAVMGTAELSRPDVAGPAGEDQADGTVQVRALLGRPEVDEDPLPTFGDDSRTPHLGKNSTPQSGAVDLENPPQKCPHCGGHLSWGTGPHVAGAALRLAAKAWGVSVRSCRRPAHRRALTAGPRAGHLVPTLSAPSVQVPCQQGGPSDECGAGNQLVGAIGTSASRRARPRPVPGSAV